ncbi:hypothetical protein K505DRAFT_328227 [Melanomma pulvis-pyrius CBS 109.77]|uniref:Uncharacterized protein n=1 Tax=Melanomma pulvis-pyrius CBS 109.77 TaxID=1314802 RepID=A0A6A6WZV0_9PLEO|nr:hypothetical protein K505DRAFT_328227 [Melanomma pulvis-pyrius CBS 109.77]
MDLDGPVSPWDSLGGHLSASREPASPSHSHPHVSGLHLPHIGRPPVQPQRYPGDGMDYRRPASLQHRDEQAFIDLTADDASPSASNAPNSRRTTARAQRPPRFAREIIDLVDEDAHRSAAPPESPEIQFISSRRLAPPRRLGPIIDPRNSDQDDVEFVGTNPLPAERRRERHHFEDMVVGVFEDMVHERETAFAHLRAHIQRAVNNSQPPIVPPRAAGQGRRAGHIHVGFIAPAMDFEMVGFDLGLGSGPVPPPPPTYDKPNAAPEGFTRSPAEDDAIICPNCKEELCLGASDLKKQVWIVKGCGHVYCGECTANRSVKKSAKGKEKLAAPRTQPFKVCVVDGCGKKTSPAKSMIQIFL